jgi:hypothetical protein
MKMLKRIGLIPVLCLCLLSDRASAQVPTVVLMQNIREHANFIGKYGSYEQLRSGKVNFGSHSDVVSQHAQQCIEAIDKAVAASVSDSKTIDVQFKEEKGWGEESKTVSLAELRALCEQLSSSAGKEDALRKARQAADNASGWSERISRGENISGPYAPVAADAANECIRSIDKALKSGNASSTVIEWTGNNGKIKMTLSDAREMCVYVRDKATGQVSSDVAAQEAEYEPFRKLLSGDKLRVYNDRLKSYKLYGAGGRVLRTPEDYRDSPLWCTTGVNREGIVPVWSVDCWHFRGMAMLGSVASRTGTGDQAPSSAFR